MLRDRSLIMGIAGESERGIGQAEDIAAVANLMPVHHAVGDGHRQRRVSRFDRHQFHAEAAARFIFRPHGLGAGAGEFRGVHAQPLRPTKTGGRFSKNARTPSA
jgi:hypothetical protein